MRNILKFITGLVFFLAVSFSCYPSIQVPAGVMLAQAEEGSAEHTYHLNKTIKHINKNTRFNLKVYGGAKKVKWISSNKKVAVVKKKKKNTAVIMGKGTGTCKIYAVVGGESLSCVVQVTGRTRKPGTFKNGAFYIGKEKIYTVKSALSDSGKIDTFGNARYLYIGASRTRDTANAVHDPEVYFYSYAGCGIDCLFRKMYSEGKWKTPGIKLIDSFLSNQPNGMVLIDLGGNDLKNIKAYISLFRSLIRRYPTAEFRFISILPREDGTNKSRMKFNKQLKKAFPTRVIDLYDFVWSHPSFGTVDGVHYGSLLSRIIYEQVMKYVGRSISVNLENGEVGDASAEIFSGFDIQQTTPVITEPDDDHETGLDDTDPIKEPAEGTGADAVNDAG